MKFGFQINEEKDPNFDFSAYAIGVIQDKGGEVVLSDTYIDTPLKEIPGVSFASYEDCDIIFSLGGDGTFLRAAQKYLQYNVPMIGVNLGSIGFMTEINKEDFEDAVDRLMAGKYTREHRSQLDVTLMSEDGTVKEHGVCLNDAVIARGLNMHVVTLDLLIDHDHVERLSDDRC